ncbi:MAG: S8 family serine peptidase [Myxococcales bacterium]|nr:S8 family serine peptidase [Myxococcales bacterium]
MISNSARRALAASLTLALAAGCAAAPETSTRRPRRLLPKEFDPTSAFVLPKAPTSAEAFVRSLRLAMGPEFQITRSRGFDRLPWVFIAWSDASGKFEAVSERLEAEPSVARVMPNSLFREQGVSAKSAKTLPWNLGDAALGGLDVAPAWRVLGDRPARPVVAVMDGEFDLAHPAFEGLLYRDCRDGHASGHDFVAGDADAGGGTWAHPTAVAGIIGPAVARGYARLLPLRISEYRNRSVEAYASLEHILAAFDYFLELKTECEGIDGALPRIVHLGFAVESPEAPEPLGEMFELARREGVLIVAPAGNHAVGLDDLSIPVWPAAYPHANLLVVTGVRRGGRPDRFANTSRAAVDAGAPSSGFTTLAPGGETRGLAGTSYASAHAAGAAALILACDDALDPVAVKTALAKTVAKSPPLVSLWGGRIDVGRAITELAAAGWCGAAP